MRRLFGRDARTGVVAGVSSAFPNMLLLAIPLVILAYGDEGAAALAVLITINLPVMMTVSAILNERALVVDGVATHTDTPAALRAAAMSLVKNPIIIGIAAGIVWRLTGLPLGGPAGIVVDRLSGVAGTLALFTVGMTLRRYGISGNVRPALVIAGLKLIVMPAIVFALLATVIHLPPVWARALVIGAACPTGVNAWLVAARFRTGEAIASNVITHQHRGGRGHRDAVAARGGVAVGARRPRRQSWAAKSTTQAFSRLGSSQRAMKAWWAGWGRYWSRPSGPAKVTMKQWVKPSLRPSGEEFSPHSKSVTNGKEAQNARKAPSIAATVSAVAVSLNLNSTTWR